MVKNIPEFIEIKIQFLRDLDPFSTTHFAEPSRAPLFTLNTDQPLYEQIPSIHRTVKAPHKIANCGLYLQDEADREFNIYLDLEMSFAEQLMQIDDNDNDDRLRSNNLLTQKTRYSHVSSSITGTDSSLNISQLVPGHQWQANNRNKNDSNSSNKDQTSADFSEKRYKMTLRTALSVRVHNVISKLYNTTGRDLRRALFCLNKVFDDYDFVSEFCQTSEGLNCLIKIGSGEHHNMSTGFGSLGTGGADNNFQNYILRAYQAVFKYVDGIEAVSKHPETIRWLYSLVNSDFKILAKQALQLIEMFLNYEPKKEENLKVFLSCVKYVDGPLPWWNMMQALGCQEAQGTAMDFGVILSGLKVVNLTLGIIENWGGV